MIKREIMVCGKPVMFRSSATVPRLYRAKFKRDIFRDLSKLEKSFKANAETGDEFAIDDLEIFENLAYIMAYHADNTIPRTSMSGSTNSRSSPSMRLCPTCWPCGATMCRRMWPQKKGWQK